MSHSKRTWQAVCTGMLCVFLGVTAFWMNCETGENDADEKTVHPGRRQRQLR